MKILKFVSEMAENRPYGYKKTFTPGIWGHFEVTPEASGEASESIHAILVGAPSFKKDWIVAFEPIGYVKVNDRGSIEYFVVGINVLNPPGPSAQEALMDRVLRFARANFIVASSGGRDGVLRITQTLRLE